MNTLHNTKTWLNKLQNIASNLSDNYESMNKLIDVEKHLIYVENFANKHEIKNYYHILLIRDDFDDTFIQEFDTYKEAIHFKRSSDFINRLTANNAKLIVKKYMINVKSELIEIPLSSNENWD